MNLGRHAGTGMLVIVCLASSAYAENEVAIPDADPADVKAVRELGTVLHDGKNHYLVFPGPHPEVGGAMFYGDGKTFYKISSDHSGGDVTREAHWAIFDERRGLDGWRSDLMILDGAYSITCRTKDNVIALPALPPADARKLLAKAAFKLERMDRRPYAMGRDGTTYYYVDAAAQPKDNSDFRLYVGKRGALKRLKLKNIAKDSEGVVLNAKEGSLRSTNDPETLTWVPKPAKKIELTVLRIVENPDLIFNELGVYNGKRFGVPCDDM